MKKSGAPCHRPRPAACRPHRCLPAATSAHGVPKPPPRNSTPPGGDLGSSPGSELRSMHLQVALNLLSEREKDELVQLVDTMVSYSVTYRNTKFVPQEKANISAVPHEVSSLSLYPPINNVINFKVMGGNKWK